MQNNRTKNTLRNSVVEIGSYIITTILNLILRIVLIRTIGVEFLGLNGLFTSILSILSITELGFSSVMWYFLYEPVTNKDTERIKSIVNVAKKVYTSIFFIIMIVSLCCLPFLQYLIDSTIPIEKIRVYFILFAGASASSYLITYKTVLLGASQKDYVDKLFSLVGNIVIFALQIIALIWLKSFLIFLIIKIAITLIRNFTINIYINRNYPYLNEKNVKKLSKEDKSQIFKKTTALFFHKIGTVIANSIDNIIITAYLTLTIVGCYSNYTLVFTSVVALITKFINGCCASVGNLWVTESKEKVEDVFDKMCFLQYWILTFCCCAIFVLTEDFVGLFFGKEFMLGQNVVLLLTLILYTSKINLTVSVFKDAKGLFWNDRFRPLIESVVNIVLSIVCLKFFGLIGVLIGTLCSYLCTIIIEPYILYKHGFNKSMKKYLIKNMLSALLCGIIIAITFLISKLCMGGIVGFVLKVVICCVVPNVILLICLFKTKGFKYFYGLIKSKLKKRANS